MFEAKCPCGEVTLRLLNAPVGEVYSHRDECQRAHGAAYVLRAIFNRNDVLVIGGNVKSWTNGARRTLICSCCGSHMFSETDGSPFRDVNAGNFPEGRFNPTAHIHCKYAVAKIADALPHFADIPSEFGGSGDVMDW